MPKSRPITSTIATAVTCLTLLTAVVEAQSDPFIDAVIDFTPGAHAGFGADELPDVVLGAPRGAGDRQGSTHVVSLGDGGSITLRFDSPVVCNEAGPDFTIFENPFMAGALTFSEIAFVEVSQDGDTFIAFPFNPETLSGSAGRAPVFSNPSNNLDPTDPAESGGDVFDLDDVGMPWIAYVRIIDAGDSVQDPGNSVPPGTSGGFDLDAIAAVHACSREHATPTLAMSTAMSTAMPAASATPTATSMPIRPGDIDGDNHVDSADVLLLITELFDGDGNLAADAGGGDLSTPASADTQRDGIIGSADIVAVVREF